MKSRQQIVVLSIALLVCIAAGTGYASEFRRTFLLEAGARYEVSVRIKTDLQDAPTLASVYIHNEHGQYLRSTQVPISGSTFLPLLRHLQELCRPPLSSPPQKVWKWNGMSLISAGLS